MSQAAKLADRFSRELDGDDPFAYNETASVSVLASAAACSGFLALAEFATTKRAARDRRQKARGRSDFWMMGDGRAWAFEFKQITGGGITSRRLDRKMTAAIDCAKSIHERDANMAVAGLIVSLSYFEPAEAATARKVLSDFKNERDFAWKIGSRDKEQETYLFFDVAWRK
ncbi:hypothetical protein VSX64_20280 [Aurantimonas sp. C2-6-R+9]|uniref:hypothetical protein n=1 Tax=unclassified Aurantimonas TaxID=2638230 RepID=UPI002E188E7B|nr:MULTISPECIES: hypothetical protein [unclassified Aurantimonas]MEC5293006.1 hypothetical protein [Aurantimonas sp. C2-3-R2]MEC5383166.1 hypothetical protein [Aurantimonas sp. C2-6-R+9]MEC5414059.1 hypothetical protein [Aurantimonas sp. C2-4-R8]